MKKDTMQITTLGDGRPAFAFWADDKTIVIIEPGKPPIFDSWSFMHEGTQTISVASVLPKAERSARIQYHLKPRPAKEIDTEALKNLRVEMRKSKEAKR